MKFLYAIPFLLFFFGSSVVSAQSTISGHVTDENDEALIGATIALLHSKDSSLVTGVVSNASGDYRLEQIKGGNYLLKASYVGHQTIWRKLIVFNGRDMNIDLLLKSDAFLLKEVEIRSAGYVVKGDTTTYFVNQYKTGQEKNLKDVLEKLPGVSIDSETQAIKANGKNVSRILVENNDLFQGSTSTPLNNLQSDGIRNVEVIDNYTEYNIYDGFRSSNETVINVNMDENAKGKVNGQATLAGGIEEKYQAKNSSLWIGKKSMASGILSANNIGNNVMSLSDVIGLNGGYNELLSNENPNEAITNLVGRYSAFIDSRSNVYKSDKGLLSFNTIFFPSRKLKILLNGIFGLDGYRLRTTDHYDYSSGISYDDLMTEKQHKNNLVTNLKVTYTPTADFNIIYSGKLFTVGQKQHIDNAINPNNLHSDSHNKNLTVDNSLLAIKKMGEHTLNLSLDVNYLTADRDYLFRSDSIFYAGRYDLPDSYDYGRTYTDHTLSAQLFDLFRLNDTYFLRIGVQSKYNKSHTDRHLVPDSDNNLFDIANDLSYFDNNLNIRFNRDKGKFKFTVGAALKSVKAQSNIQREFLQSHRVMVSPDMRLTYSFKSTHVLMLNYDEHLSTHGIDDLNDGRTIASYNQLSGSSVNNYFAYKRSASLLHQLVLMMQGITLVNVLSFEHDENAVVDDYSMNNIIRYTNKRLYSGGQSLVWQTQAEKKFMFMPLNAKVTFNYTHSKQPFFQSGEQYNSKYDLFRVGGSLTTYYKTGFNGKFTVDYVNSRYGSTLAKSKSADTGYLWLVSYNTKKWFVSFDVRYRDYRLNDNNGHYTFCDFTGRYNLSDKVTLQINGNDVFHLAKRVQSSGTVNSYFSTYRTLYYMPGHILAGVAIKY